MGVGDRARAMLLGALLIIPMLATPVAGLAQAELVSGALGLTRPEIEEQWGQGVGPFAGPGPYFGIYEMYSYFSQRGTYHVAYQDTNGQEIAVYLEINLPGGMSEREARALAGSYLPADAEQTEVYTAPPSPDGATALQMYRYQSPALDAAYGGILAGEVLVIFYERWDDPDFEFGRRVTAVSLIVRTITQ
jgi:hypothetical protein